MNFIKPPGFLIVAASAAPVTAGEIKPHRRQAVEKLATDGKLVLLASSAPWRPTGKQRTPSSKAC